MLPKAHRPTVRDIAKLSRARTIRTPYFSARFSPSDARKVGFVVPKKVAKDAVKRNAMRRKCYAVARNLTHFVESSSGAYTILITILQPLPEKHEVLIERLRALFEKIR